MKRILLTLMATIAGSLSASVVVAGPSIGVVLGIPPIVIGAPVYRPAPVYYAPVVVAPGYYGGHGYYGGYRGNGHGHYNRGC